MIGIKETYIGYVPPASTKEPGVYFYKQLDTGKTYIGSTVDAYGRFIQHSSSLTRNDHSNHKFQKAFNESPYFEIDFCRIPDHLKNEDPLLTVRKMEQQFIDDFEPKSKLLNIAKDVFANGTAISPSAETRAKISASSMGRIVTQETRDRQSASLKGRIISQEARDKVSLALKGRKQDEARRALSKKAGMTRATPVKVGDTIYESLKAAGDAFDIDSKSVKKRIKSKNFNEWSYSENNTLGSGPSL